MNKYNFILITMLLVGVGGCTSLSEGQANMPPPARVNERVTLQDNHMESLRDRMGQQASEINRKRNIEQFDRNEPAMTPNALRPRQLPYAPIDSTRHNIYWPIYPFVQPLPTRQ